jgi:spermidine/putrescine transport system substrate-binding protein
MPLKTNEIHYNIALISPAQAIHRARRACDAAHLTATGRSSRIGVAGGFGAASLISAVHGHPKTPDGQFPRQARHSSPSICQARQTTRVLSPAHHWTGNFAMGLFRLLGEILMKPIRLAPLTLLMSCCLVWTAQALELRVFEWEGYISPYKAEFEVYAKSKGKDIILKTMTDAAGKPKFIGSADDIFVALRDDQTDVVTPTNNYFKAENGKLLRLLHAMDVTRLNNYGDLPESLRQAQYSVDAGKPYAVPLLAGSYAIAYNAATTREAPTSWADLLNPKFAGKISVTNDQFEANIYSMALLAGVKPQDVYDIEKIDRKAVQENLNKLVRNSGPFWGGLATVTDMAHLDIITDYGMAVTAANAAGQNWQFTKLKEGETVWLDNVSIAKAVEKDPAKLEAAYLLVDFLISAKVQAEIVKDMGVVAVNPKAGPLPPAGSPAAELAGDATFFKEERFWQPLSSRTRNAYRQMWDEALKAAGK